jgi:hypothetical protein
MRFKCVVTCCYMENPCRLWFTRPPPPAAVEYAADDVRYLLPAAQLLLQQLPAALMCIGSLQQLLTQQGPDALRLQQQLLPGYGQLLLPPAETVQGSNSSSPGAVTQRGLTQMQFELKAEFTAANTGWFRSSYVVYMNDAHDSAAAAAAAAAVDDDAAAGSSSSSSKLVGVDGSKAVLQADGSSTSSSSSIGSSASAASSSADNALGAEANDRAAGSGSSSSSAAADDEVDEAVLSIAELLPDRWGLRA